MSSNLLDCKCSYERFIKLQLQTRLQPGTPNQFPPYILKVLIEIVVFPLSFCSTLSTYVQSIASNYGQPFKRRKRTNFLEFVWLTY